MGLFFFLSKISFLCVWGFPLTYVSTPHVVHGGQEVTSDPWNWICHVGDGNQIRVPPEEQQVLFSTEVPLQPQACFSNGEIGVSEGQASCYKNYLLSTCWVPSPVLCASCL